MKKKIIFLGLAALTVNIAACIPPAQALLALTVIGMGIVTAVKAVYEDKKKTDVAKTHKRDLDHIFTINPLN